MRKRALYIFIAILVITVTFQGQAKSSVGQEPVSLGGTFLIMWGDGAAQNPGSVSRYFLALDSGEHVELEFSPPLATGTNLLRLFRQPVTISGDWSTMSALESRVFRVDQIAVDETKLAEPQGVFGHQPWVSVLCKFSDYTIEPKDLAYFQGMFSESYPGLDHYWREQSFDNVDLVGSGAFGWYTLPNPRSYYVPPSGYMDWWTAAEECSAVADDYIDFSQYVGINFMFNADLDGYAWGGSWSTCLDGVCKTWRATWEPPWGYGNIGVIAHENGHGFGLPHSSGDYGLVYDNAWDVMSDLWSNGNRGGVHPVYGTMGQHTIAYHKGMLEWIDNEHMVEVPTGSGISIPIERIAIPQTDHTLGVKVLINNSTSEFYTVESRKFSGYDSWLPGQAVVIHHVDVYRPEPAHVVDIDGNGNTGDAGAMWLPGETFTDSAHDIAVTVKSITDSGFYVSIENGCVDLCSVDVHGQEQGFKDQEYNFLASVVPIDATQPITYVWRVTDHDPITHTGGIDDSAVFTWSRSGTMTVEVTATNSTNIVHGSTTIEIIEPAEEVVIEGLDYGVVGAGSIYTATIQPVTATLPILYVWQASEQETVTKTGGIMDTMLFTWNDVGSKTITVTASNPGSVVTDTFTVLVQSFAPDSVAISGRESGTVGIEQEFQATVLPITATLPITYVWQATGQETVTNTGGLTDTIVFTWHEPGEQVVDLLVVNAMGEVTTTFKTVVVTPALEVEISGAVSGFSGQEYLFSAQVSPISATQPVTYTWITSGMMPITHANGLSDTITLGWDSSGEYLVTLQVSNRYVDTYDTWEIRIIDRIFIPLVKK